MITMLYDKSDYLMRNWNEIDLKMLIRGQKHTNIKKCVM